MATPYLSEIRIFSFNYAPKGWAMCNGQLMSINSNQALFALLGTTYGGDGRNTFALPNLQGRVPIHMGDGYVLGEIGGEENHTLLYSEMAQHNHPLNGVNAVTAKTPANNLPGKGTPGNFYGSNLNATMNATAITNNGSSQPHTNLAPYLALNFCIALQGVFPSQN